MIYKPLTKQAMKSFAMKPTKTKPTRAEFRMFFISSILQSKCQTNTR